MPVIRLAANSSPISAHLLTMVALQTGKRVTFDEAKQDGVTS
jgi:hypothetical protein